MSMLTILHFTPCCQETEVLKLLTLLKNVAHIDCLLPYLSRQFNDIEKNDKKINKKSIKKLSKKINILKKL